MADGKIQFEISGDEVKVLQSFERTIQKQEKMIAKLKQVGKAGQKAGKQTQGAFGSKALASLKSYATGLVGISAASAAVLKVLREIRQVSDEAGNRIKDSITGRQALAQIADTPAELKKLVESAQGLRSDQGLSAEQAFRTTFSAASAGQLRNLRLFGKLSRVGFAPEAGIAGVQKVQAAFGPEAGSAREIINQLFASAKQSPVGAAEIARAASASSATFAGIGGTGAELLSTISELSKPFKSPEAASERVKSLASQVQRKRGLIDAPARLRGLELLRQLPRLAEEGKLLSEGGEAVPLTKFIGEANALEALGALQKQGPEIDATLGRVRRARRETGSPEGVLSRKLALVEGDPQTAATFRTQTAEQQRLLSSERKLGTPELLADALIAREEARRREEGFSEPRLFVAGLESKFQRFVLGSERFLRARKFLGTDFEAEPGGAAAAQREAAAAQREAAEVLRTSAGSMRARPDLGPDLSERE